MRPYRGLTKEGKWVKGWYFEAAAPSSNEYVVKSFIITKSWSVVYIDADGEYQFEAKCIVEVLPETVGHNTGLHDKNDKDLDWWEGDRFQFYLDSQYTIMFQDGAFYFVNDDGKRTLCSQALRLKEFPRIIGTIHDKKELPKE